MAEKQEIKITFNEGIVKKLPHTGVEYYDKFMRGCEKRAYRIVKMSFKDFCRVAYSDRDTLNEKLRDPLKSQKLELPIIDIENKSSLGKGKAIVANAAGVKLIPVLVFAKKPVHIDSWKTKKGIK